MGERVPGAAAAEPALSGEAGAALADQPASAEPAPAHLSAPAAEPALARALSPGAFLLIVDPQAIFADPRSDWYSPFWAEYEPRILELARAFKDRVIVTRWLPTADRSTAWGDYFKAWPFADVPADDPLYALLPGFAELSPHPVVDEPTFGKWGPQLQRVLAAAGGEGRSARVDPTGAGSAATGVAPAGAGGASTATGDVSTGDVSTPTGGAPVPDLVVTGVSTDCCVISTVLPAADAGARITVVTDACAASTVENGAAATHVMSLYPPQVQLASTAQVLASLP